MATILSPGQRRRCANPACWDFLSPAVWVPLCVSCRAAFAGGAASGGVLAAVIGTLLAIARWGSVFVVVGLVLVPVAVAQTIPRAALQYQRPLIANARAVWGLDAPIAVMAAQVHQESGWRPDAQSKYANGLAQFTPATADWISARYAGELGDNQPFNPAWALRALARYDKFLYDRATAATDCDRWAFTLSGYNGGEGWVTRDKRKASALGADTLRWFGHVERFSDRAAWAIRENRDYPRRILLVRQPPYRAWGPGVDCAL